MDWLKQIRLKKELTQKETALRAKITPQHYNYIERGLRNPSPGTAVRIAEVLDFDWERFFENNDAEE